MCSPIRLALYLAFGHGYVSHPRVRESATHRSEALQPAEWGGLSCARSGASTHAAALLSLPLRAQLTHLVQSTTSPTPPTVRCVLAALQLLRDGGLTGHATPPVSSLAASAAPHVWAVVRPLLLRTDAGLGLVRFP